MSTQAIATPGQLQPTNRVRAGGRGTTASLARPRLSAFDRALAASLERRAEIVQTVAVESALSQPGRNLVVRWRAWLRPAQQAVARGLAIIHARRAAQGGPRLRLIETLPLGEKRAVAILAVGGAQYLVGHGPAGISLLAKLEEAKDVVSFKVTPGEISSHEDAPVTRPTRSRKARPRETLQESR